MTRLYCHHTLTDDETMQLSALDTHTMHSPNLRSGAEILMNLADGLILKPGWENDEDTQVLVKLAKAFELPVRTYMGWLLTLPDPEPAHAWPAVPDHAPTLNTLTNQHDPIDVVDLETGDPIFTEPWTPDEKCDECGGPGWVNADGGPGYIPCPRCDAPPPLRKVFSEPWLPQHCKHVWVSDNGVPSCENCGSVQP